MLDTFTLPEFGRIMSTYSLSLCFLLNKKPSLNRMEDNDKKISMILFFFLSKISPDLVLSCCTIQLKHCQSAIHQFEH